MAGFRIDKFRGLRPRISAKKLQPGEAVTAQNLKLGSGDLEPIPEKTTEQAVGSGRSSRTIYKFDNSGSPIWFEWDDYVDVVRGPVKDDSLERTYYTGDTYGTGAPKMTTNALADLGGGGPYPEDWLYIGVPAPATAPTVTPTDLPEDKPPGERLAEEFRSDTLFIDQVKWTTYPGTGTRDTTWNLNSAARGSIVFEVEPGTAFRVASVISANKVTLESATEPGITVRTRNSDKTTVNDWQPMDNNGSTQEADWLGWRVPDGMEARIVDHKLNVGDVITVSARNNFVEFWAALTTDFTEESWSVESAIADGATTFYQVLDAEVSGESFSGDGAWRISGSFYYDVDRSASDSSELEDRSYVYTYVNEFGEEGPPSPASDATPLLDGQSVLISAMDLPPTIGYNINMVRLYRTNSTEAGTEYQFVKEFDVAKTTRDEVLSKNLGEVISTTTWDPPDPLMKGIVALPNGVLAGFNGKQLYFCEPYFPHAWPPEYDQAVDYEIVGIAPFGNSLAVMTKGWPYIATGSHPRNMNVKAIKINQACLSKEGIATDGDRVYYPSPDGLVEVGVNGIGVKTEPWLDPKDWKAYEPATMVGEFYEGRYYGFWDFDVSSVDPVITAELSGTITDAAEGDIVNGGKTIIITLQNDQWVAAGVSFNNQRAAIIAALTCTTDQTLGWNNIIRDSELAVGDVVRTSDTVATITLPTASGYAITSEERVDFTVPAAALLLSNTAIPAGSHFRITPDEASATVTLSGTLGGAAEADVVTGGNTVIITLVNDTWQTTLTTAMKQLIVDGIVSTTNEIDGWNDHVPQLITASTDVVRTSDTVVTVTLPAVPLYSVTENESIQAIVPHQALTLQMNQDAISSNSLGIIATGVATALFGGTATASMTENEVVAGGKVLTITLTNDTWIAAGTGPIGTTAQTQSILDALVATTSQTLGWNNVVQPGIETADLVRTSSTVATITLDAEATYSIADNETISATFPGDVFTGGAVIAASNSFGVQAQTPVTATLSGTVTSATEDDIVAGGKTLILTLSDDTWLAAGTGPIGSTANTQAIIDGLTAATSPTNGWNNEIRDGSLGTGDVVRTSDTVCTITIGADAQYDISANETITATIPAAALNISASAVVASPTFNITFNPPATAAITGTADGAASSAIVVGGTTIIITLTDDTWVTAGATFNAIRQDIIDGLDAAASPTHGWNNEVRDGTLLETNVVRTSDTVVTITLPATSAYDINAAEAITVTVPASALTTSASPITGDVTVDITASSASTSTIMIGSSDANGAGGTIYRSYFDPAYMYEFADPTGDTQGSAMALGWFPGTDRWVANVGDWGSPYDGKLMTSDDNGDTWTERTAAFEPDYVSAYGNAHIVHDDVGAIFTNSGGVSSDSGVAAQWSTDGVTWTNITAAMIANLSGTGFIYLTPQKFLWDGTYLYCKCSMQNLTSGFEIGFIRSADISGAGDVNDDWGSEIISSMDYTYFRAAELGEGYLIHVGRIGTDTKLEYMTQGGTSLTLASGAFPSSSRGYPFFVLHDGANKWIALNYDSYGWEVDTTGGTLSVIDPTDWTASSSYLFGSGAEYIISATYDKGSDGTNGLGFVVITREGSGASLVARLYSSTDGDSWTLQHTFPTGEFFEQFGMAGKHPLQPSDIT